jgi:hypothetical protein
MHKLIVAIAASLFALASASAFAADATPKKKEELTKEERADMRARADQLTAARAQGLPEHHIAGETTPKAKKHHAGKSKKSPPAPAKTEPKT